MDISTILVVQKQVKIAIKECRLAGITDIVRVSQHASVHIDMLGIPHDIIETVYTSDDRPYMLGKRAAVPIAVRKFGKDKPKYSYIITLNINTNSHGKAESR